MIIRRATLESALLWIVAPMFAQWIHYPTPGIPRLPDGRPNLSAATPRTADAVPETRPTAGRHEFHA